MVVKISVVVPVFNTERYLKKCLNSLINQTFKDIEIICVNDGSTDSSLNILNNYSKKDERIKIINQENSGPGASRNNGLAECKGEYVSFVDSDDWISEDLFEKTYEQLKSDNLDMIMFPSVTYDEESGQYDENNDYYNLNSLKKGFSNKIFNCEDRLFGIPTDPVNKLYRRELLFKNKIKFPEEIYFEDNVFFFDVYLKVERCAVNWDVNYFRRYREGSITNRADDKYFDLIEVYTLIVNIFKESGNYEKFKYPLLHFLINIFILNYNTIESQYKKEFYKMIGQFFKDLNLSNEEFNSLTEHDQINYNKFMNPVWDKDLFVSYAFPPFSDTSAIVVAIRLFYHDSKVDVVQNNLNVFRNIDESLNEVIDGKVYKKFITNVKPTTFHWDEIKGFVLDAKKQIDDYTFSTYNRIYSRAMLPPSHFFAFEYKLEHPETYWIAEFSDPLLHEISGKLRIINFEDNEFMERLNNLLKDLNLPEGEKNVAFLAEYIPFVFADEIIFNNENQMKFMCDSFPHEELRDKILKKSKIKPVNSLPKEFYYKINSNYYLDESKVNFAYFGVFYGHRNFEGLYYALESLDEHLKDQFTLNIFTNNKEFIDVLISDLSIKRNIIVNDYVDFLEFLNLCTKFDCLIVNDSAVKENFSINPYLPSKIRDYLGSGSDIWALCEEDSILSKKDVKYKSFLNDYASIRQTFNQIIYDKLDISLKDEKNEIEELKQEIKFLKKRNDFLNVHVYNFNKSVNNLKQYIKNSADPYVKQYVSSNKIIKRQLLELSQIKSYKIAYFLYLTQNKFIRGNKADKKFYIKWLYSKILKKDFNNQGTNPLLNIIEKL